jgi:TatD DNase family protein
MQWIDLHAHLDKLPEGSAVAIKQAQSVDVKKIVTIGTDPLDLPVVLELAQNNPGVVYCTLGIHPHDGAKWSEDVAQYLHQNLLKPQVVAVGEIGLDYYYTQSPVEEQKQAFVQQLEIAAQYNLPVEIHTRDAEKDTVDILNQFRGKLSGIIHCFTGTQWLAEKALDLGLNISISGIVTFKNADALRDVVRYLPLDRMHVETDSPFLAPVPQRGKSNTPAYVVHTAKYVAQLKNIELESFSQQMWANAEKVFPRLQH